MTPAINWSGIRLVAFDVDGTLYSQRLLRARMMLDLALHVGARRNTATLRILKFYRHLREELGTAEATGFETRLLDEVAQRHRVTAESVRALVADWVETRPLPYLRRCRYAGVETLFDRIRSSGRQIGILSDYPAAAKIEALGLAADHIISADQVGVQKPSPEGLRKLMERAGTAPHETLLIGDRADRDDAAARRVGVACLIRSRKPVPGVTTFERFDAGIFDGLVGTSPKQGGTDRIIDAGGGV